MSLIRCSVLLVLLLPVLAWSDTEEIQIPAKFNSVPTGDSGAYAFANKCMPSITETAFKDFTKDVSGTSAMIDRPANRNDPFLVVNSTRTICVAMSKTRHPILPTEIFDDTVSFVGMSADDEIALRVVLAQQLAQTGAASALVKNDKGNAVAIYYMFASDTPDKVYYHAAFLKPGEFDESKFPLVTHNTGGMSVKAQGRTGQAIETYKFLYQK